MTAVALGGRLATDRWPSELPLFTLVVLVSLGIWFLLILSVFGLIYAVMIGLFFLAGQMIFIAHLRGSAVRIGPDQFPELHARVVQLSEAMEMTPPAAYLMQAGGTLNAFATRFFRRRFIVLLSDLLEACGDDQGARDMIITHELAHLRCGHLSWRWLTLPGQFVPFLGTALSRAREYTCDRYGALGAGSRQSAVRGLTILAAGASLAPQVNLQAFAGQRADLNTGFMTLGEWMSTHPPLVKRVAAVDPSLAAPVSTTRGSLAALALLALLLFGVTVVAVLPV
jgi:Zn-dependent protease with chaperone function